MEREEAFGEERPGQEDAGRLINIVSHQLKRTIFLSSHQENGLTSMQNRILHFILLRTMEKPLYQKDIEKEFNIRKSTATEILKLMEKNGFICRECSKKDARLKEIIPTQKALAMRQNVMESIRATEAKLRQGVSEADYETFMQVLKKMSDNLGAKE